MTAIEEHKTIIMAHSGQNPALNESFLPSSRYNELPHISSMMDATDMHHEAKDKLLELIFEHGVDQVFSVHLIHKHFDAPEDHIMVYETFISSNHPTFQIFGPRSINTTTPLRGKFFLAVPENTMRAYEYTSDPLPDVSQYTGFITAFSRTVVELGVERIFSLTVRTPDSTEYNEIELPDFQATVLVQKSDWVPAGISTDWMNVIGALNVGGVPIREVCSGSRCTPGMYHGRAFFEDESLNKGKGSVLIFNGVTLSPGSEAFNILSHARQYISVI